MIIKSSLRDYEVAFYDSPAFLPTLPAAASAFYVVDQQVLTAFPGLLDHIPSERLMPVAAREENKTVEGALEICERMTRLSAKRNTVLVSIGGGIIQDLTGFVAHILYRGLEWHYVPTTLLAACDSCIGGKNSINFGKYKNLLGTFYPPRKIYIYPGFFDTLSQRDFCSGLGEVVKFNIIAGASGKERIAAQLPGLLARDRAAILECVRTSLDFKRRFIEADEFDRKERILLNFAHTFGHALESTSGYQIPHGTAVATGMLLANRISLGRGLLDAATVAGIEGILRQIILIPMQPAWFELEALVAAIRKDKKQLGEALTAILLDGDYRLRLVHDVQVAEIRQALAPVLALLPRAT
jgi:3-dehydroquinate synthase